MEEKQSSGAEQPQLDPHEPRRLISDKGQRRKHSTFHKTLLEQLDTTWENGLWTQKLTPSKCTIQPKTLGYNPEEKLNSTGHSDDFLDTESRSIAGLPSNKNFLLCERQC
jgi:hypothetical protein